MAGAHFSDSNAIRDNQTAITAPSAASSTRPFASGSNIHTLANLSTTNTTLTRKVADLNNKERTQPSFYTQSNNRDVKYNNIVTLKDLRSSDETSKQDSKQIEQLTKKVEEVSTRLDQLTTEKNQRLTELNAYLEGVRAMNQDSRSRTDALLASSQATLDRFQQTLARSETLIANTKASWEQPSIFSVLLSPLFYVYSWIKKK